MKKYSKLLCAILTLCMILTVLPFGVLAASDNPVSFTDVKGHWAEDFIVYWSNTTAVNGEGYVIGGYADKTFKPDACITRGAAAAILDRAAGFERTNATKDFPDVVKDSTFYANIMACADNGVINGYNDGTFRPQSNITRQAAIAMIARCAMGDDDYKEFSNAADCRKILDKFEDADKISSNFYAEICFLMTYGNLQGYNDGTLRPENNITRAEFIKLLFTITNGAGTPVVPGKTYNLEVSVTDGENTVKVSADKLTSDTIFVSEMLSLAVENRDKFGEKFASSDLEKSIETCCAIYAADSMDGKWSDKELTDWLDNFEASFGEAEADIVLILAALDPEATLGDMACNTYTASMKDAAGVQYTLTVTISESAAQ